MVGAAAASPALPSPAPTVGLIGPKVLTNAAQILSLSPEQLQAGIPVQIQGRITCESPRNVLFVQDATAGVFVFTDGARPKLGPFAPVKVTGVAEEGLFSPIIASPIVEPIDTAPELKPLPVSLGEVYLGGLDAQWVELTAEVRGQEITGNRLRLELADPPYTISAWVPQYNGYQELSLVGCRVRVRAVVGVIASEHQPLWGFQLFANTLSDITVLRRARPDPFSLPLSRVSDLKTYRYRAAGSRVHIRGIVSLCWPGQALFIQDASGGVEVRPHDLAAALPPGTQVDAVGFPGPILKAARLEDAIIRTLATNAPPQAFPLNSDSLFSSHDNLMLVAADSEFQGMGSTLSNSIVLALTSGGRFFTALLNPSTATGEELNLTPGSRLRVIGVRRVVTDPRGVPAVSLLLRSPADIAVVATPEVPLHRGGLWLGGAAAVTTLALALALLLIQRQRRRTEELLKLQAQLQAEMLQGEQQLRRSVEERERIARDLHDDIIQSIYGVGLNLEDCRRVVRRSPEEAEQRLAAVVHTLNTTIQSVRGFISGLESSVINGREFKVALKSLTLSFGEVPTRFHVDVDPASASALTPAQATQLFHIAKESMSNALRHARASDITVTLHPGGSGLRLEISDDGDGFNPAAPEGSGQGLRNLRARAREIGAELQIRSAHGEGCRIIVNIPQRNSSEPN